MRTPPPPLLVSFKSPKTLLDALPPNIAEQYAKEIDQLIDKSLPPAVSVSVISVIFGVSSNFISSLLRDTYKQYRTFTIRKGKKKRKIESPRVGLKLIQSWLGYNIASSVVLSDCVYGFIPKVKGVFEAAQKHCMAKWVYSIDLRDFFPSVSNQKINHELMKIGYSKNAAELIVKVCTFEDRLPQGSPASPILSNIAFRETDEKLEKLTEDLQIRYSRYADDLVFSGLGDIPEGLQDKIKEIVVDDGWTLADEKEHLAMLPNRLKVHGLLVHGEKPRLTKGYRNRIRAYQYLIKKDKVKENDMASFKGHISYFDSLFKFNND